jgi:hypothetical protein
MDMPLKPPARTLHELITCALAVYDGSLPDEPKKFKKGFFRTHLPSYKETHIEQLRIIKHRLEEKPEDEKNINDVKEEIKKILLTDPDYPNKESAHQRCELILDFFLFDAEIYLKKAPKNLKFINTAFVFQQQDPLRMMVLNNLLYLGFSDFIEKQLSKNRQQTIDQLNEYVITAIANAKNESALYLLTNYAELINLATLSEFSTHNTALMLAIAKGRHHLDADKGSAIYMAELIDALLLHPTARESVNLQDSLGMTALHLAVLQRDSKTVKVLLDRGADPTIKNKEGMTAWDYLDISRKEAKEHLNGYCTSGFTRGELLKRIKDEPLSKFEFMSQKTYTVAKKAVWLAETAEIEKAKATLPSHEEKHRFG